MTVCVIERVRETPRYMRPSGGGTTSEVMLVTEADLTMEPWRVSNRSNRPTHNYYQFQPVAQTVYNNWQHCAKSTFHVV